MLGPKGSHDTSLQTRSAATPNGTDELPLSSQRSTVNDSNEIEEIHQGTSTCLNHQHWLLDLLCSKLAAVGILREASTIQPSASSTLGSAGLWPTLAKLSYSRRFVWSDNSGVSEQLDWLQTSALISQTPGGRTAELEGLLWFPRLEDGQLRL
ncbi:hypothetical protein RRG08_029958 [Elysia crispata]|uniref:Uncharacterized protein n=1 Tax=Elysia crispata TaxID=231223 RepID=A0AAE0ZIX3_9GAST|nr:hypothetical protein RRG08_029958 [Elysia crispata]